MEQIQDVLKVAVKAYKLLMENKKVTTLENLLLSELKMPSSKEIFLTRFF